MPQTLSRVNPPGSLPEELRPIWLELRDQVRSDIGLVGLEALCIQVCRMRDAQARILKDGSIVLDARGVAVAHPALAVEKQAQAEIRIWLDQYGCAARR